jgi:hypothetical protein
MPSLSGKFHVPYHFLAVLIAAMLFRLPSFFLDLIDPDEWTYWISAKECLAGKDLYSDIIDIKPPGIFIVFAVLIKGSLGSFFLARMWSALLLGVAAYSIGSFSSQLLRDERLKWPASLLFLCGFSYPFGQALNTEVFFVSFTCIGLCLLLRNRPFSAMVGFLMLGLAFSIKYTALSEISIGVLIISIPLLKESKYKEWLLTGFSGVLLVLMPFALMHVYFYTQGNWDAFLHVVYSMPGKYAGSGNLKAKLDLLALFHFRFFWLVIPAYMGLRVLALKNRPVFFLFVYWLLASWFMVVLTGKLHDHYWLQLMPVYALCASVCMVEFASSNMRIGLILAGMLSVFALSSLRLYKNLYGYNLQVKTESAAFVQKFGSGKTVWYAGMPAVYYELTHSRVPTPYLHGSLLFSEKHIQGFGIKVPDEWIKAIQHAEITVIPAERQQESLYSRVIKLCRDEYSKEEISRDGRYLIFSREGDAPESKRQ